MPASGTLPFDGDPAGEERYLVAVAALTAALRIAQAIRAIPTLLLQFHGDETPAQCLAAAAAGDESAYFDLGVIYSTGSHGVDADLIEAHKWFNLAAVNGHGEAQMCRADISDEMTAREIAEAADIKAICCFSQSGTTVSLVARERPRVPILALTPLIETARRMCLTWGAHCVVTEEQERFKGAVISAVRAARTYGFATETDQIVLTAGVPFNVQGTTNILRVAPCDERLVYKAPE